VQVGHGFEQMLYQLVAYLIAGAAVFLFLQLLIYSTITLRKFRRSKDLKRLMPQWSREIDSYLRSGRRKDIPNMEKNERKIFRDLLISYYSGVPQDPSNPDLMVGRILHEGQRRRLRILYRELGFIQEDMEQIEEGMWWDKAVALGRLARLELNDAEDLAVDLLENGNGEVVLSCISYLTSIKSRFLSGRVAGIVSSSDLKDFKELTLELLKADIDVGTLKDLSSSEDPKCRAASAVLLGRRGKHFNTGILRKLSKDEDPQVRAEAARSLARVQTTSAVRILEDMTWDTDREVGRALEEAFESVDESRAVTHIGDLGVWEKPPERAFTRKDVRDFWASEPDPVMRL